VPGAQVYVAAPPAVSEVDEPEHIATLEPAVTDGSALTTTVTLAVLVHPIELVPVKV
jgi:hypothetical protein